MNRRIFLSISTFLSSYFGLFSKATASNPSSSVWRSGHVLHILPTVSDSEFLIKVSFKEALKQAPALHVGTIKSVGQANDSEGKYWQFHVKGLGPQTSYRLSLKNSAAASSALLCDPWELRTFPAPGTEMAQMRLLVFTCTGGHEMHGFLPTATRNRLLKRALSFKPDAAIANGDHVYWDLRSPFTAAGLGQSESAKHFAGLPDRSLPILGTTNEDFLKKTAGPQIVPVYATDFRSTPTFFIQDDHDYYENDDAEDAIVTFPPDHFMTEMARATQLLFYPEFLPDASRPAGLPGASAQGKAKPISESFGTLRYGQLLEVLMYSVRRSMTMAGQSAVFLEDTVEQWLLDRMKQESVQHVLNVPSNPPGWSAGKWGEWYPDVFSSDGKLTTDQPKPYWQTGWLKQHDRLLQAMSNMKHRTPLVISGDLHASALGKITQTGAVDLSANPVYAVLSGSIGTRDTGWPSGKRKVLPQPSKHLKMQEIVKPIELHGFTLIDFTPHKTKVQMFTWDKKNQSLEDIDTLQPYKTFEL
jgi:hypothetical protein